MRSAVTVSRVRQSQFFEGHIKPLTPSASSARLSITWKESLYLATLGGAKALGQYNTGTFKLGNAFDAQWITVADSEASKIDLFKIGATGDQMTLEEIVEKWFCLGNVQSRKAVWIGGRKVL